MICDWGVKTEIKDPWLAMISYKGTWGLFGKVKSSKSTHYMTLLLFSKFWYCEKTQTQASVYPMWHLHATFSVFLCFGILSSCLGVHYDSPSRLYSRFVLKVPTDFCPVINFFSSRPTHFSVITFLFQLSNICSSLGIICNWSGRENSDLLTICL